MEDTLIEEDVIMTKIRNQILAATFLLALGGLQAAIAAFGFVPSSDAA